MFRVPKVWNFRQFDNLTLAILFQGAFLIEILSRQTYKTFDSAVLFDIFFQVAFLSLSFH